MVDVPNVTGVPSVAFLPTSSVLPLLSADTFTYFGAFGQQWGIFLSGAPVVVADTVVGLDYRQEWAISDYPIEEGSFESYDKVALPFEGRVRFAAGFNEANRQSLLDSIAAIAGDLNLYDIVSPEEVYSNVNIHHYDYHRAALNGLGLLIVDVWCTEIRQATVSFGSTAAPSGATPSNNGTVQSPSSPSSGGLPFFASGASIPAIS